MMCEIKFIVFSKFVRFIYSCTLTTMIYFKINIEIEHGVGCRFTKVLLFFQHRAETGKFEEVTTLINNIGELMIPFP